jgi:hypothetical protein
MLGLLTVIIMLLVGYAYLVEGLFTACVMCCNVVAAGLVAFNFYEPLADQLDMLMGGTGYEDAICLVAIFSLTLGTLRGITNLAANTAVEFHPAIQLPGGALFGLITGYLVSGFVVCVMQTLPMHEHFMSFEARTDSDQPAIRRFLPPDRVWLAMLHRAGEAGFSSGAPTFDAHASFELRYARYRRYKDKDRDHPDDARKYDGAFDPEMYPSLNAPAGQ